MSAIIFNSRRAGIAARVAGAERFALLAEVNNIARNTTVGEAPGPIPGIAQLNACLGPNGTDLSRFIARLSAQVELTCWVDGPHRQWLAGIMQRGLHTGLLRPGMGWVDAIGLLMEAADEPVFISCSAGEVFPYIDRVGEGLSEATAWQQAEQLLRAESAREDATAHLADHPTELAAPFSRELRPSNWEAYFFAESVNY